MAISGTQKLGGKRLTDELRKLAVEAITIDDAGNPRTREQVLSEMIWRQALGWEEKVRNDDGVLKTVKHPPVAWCQQFLWERMEGKATPAQAESGDGIRALDKVRELARDRLNGLVKKPVASGPPSHKAKA